MIGAVEFLTGLAAVAPVLVFWIAVIVLAVVMLRRSGGRAERFLITGASLNAISSLLSVPVTFIVPWLLGKGHDMDYSISVSSGTGIFLNVISAVGIGFLVYAFYVKFKTREPEGEVLLPQD